MPNGRGVFWHKGSGVGRTTYCSRDDSSCNCRYPRIEMPESFLYLLREFNCLFLGMSMTDENIRRLLHYSTSEHRQRAMERGQRLLDRIALRHFAILKRSGTKKIDELTDIALRRLGTRALWITGFEEIPARLAYVCGEEAWANVY
jgi:hypothetical protein